MAKNKYLHTYAQYLKKLLKVQRPLKVVFDASNGSSGLLFQLVAAKQKNLSVIFLNNQPDGQFPAHGPNPLEQNAIDQLAAVVKKEKANLGIAVDNDGDRAFFCDETGRSLSSTEALVFLGDQFQGPVVVDFMIGPLAYQYFEKLKRPVVTTRVGLYFIKKAIAESGAQLAGEYSGHFYFKEIFGSDCAVMAAIHFINKLSSSKINLSGHLSSLPRYYQTMVNFPYARENFGELASLLTKKFQKTAQKVSNLDGVKIEFANYWFNLRPSNTEDLMRLTVEADKEDLLNETVIRLKKILPI